MAPMKLSKLHFALGGLEYNTNIRVRIHAKYEPSEAVTVKLYIGKKCMSLQILLSLRGSL